MNYSQVCLPALTVKQEQHNTQRAQEVSRLFGCPRYQEHYGEILIHDAITFPVTGIVFVTGTSGSGKTSLLNTVFKTIPNTQMLEEFSNIEVSLVDAFCDEFKWSVAQCLRWLGCFGLAEARVYLTSFRYLSEGQKYRARLARLLAKNPSCVVIDEFLSVLDRQTARVVAFQFQKLCRMHGIAAIIASSHNDLIEPLGVDSLVLIHLNRKIDIKHFKDKKLSPCLSELNSLTVQEGTWDDYNALAPFHYMDNGSTKEFTSVVDQIRVIRLQEQPIAVLLSGRPFPNILEKIPLFERINKSIIVRYRTIVHPSFRGIGLTKLLEPKLTSFTRVILAFSAMGKHFPFHLASGYKKIVHSRVRRLPEHDQLEKLLLSISCGNSPELHQSVFADRFIKNLNQQQLQQLDPVIRSILVQENLDYLLFLAKLIGKDIDSKTSLKYKRFFLSLLDPNKAPLQGCHLSEALHFPMEAFVKIVQGTYALAISPSM